MDNLSRGVARRLTISLVLGAGLFAGSFVQTNLVSDLPGAAYMDSNLKNPWGMSFGPTTPFWVSDQMTGVSTLYSTTSMPVGQPVPLVVSIPPSASGPQGPTGQVFNGTAGFEVNPGHAALFIFSTLGG